MYCMFDEGIHYSFKFAEKGTEVEYPMELEKKLST